MSTKLETRRLRQQLRAEMQRFSGRRYQIDLDALDPRSLRELLRFVRDAVHEKRRAEQRALRQPWRHR